MQRALHDLKAEMFAATAVSELYTYIKGESERERERERAASPARMPAPSTVWGEQASFLIVLSIEYTSSMT